MKLKYYSLSARIRLIPRGWVLTLIFLMLFFNDFLWTQVPKGQVRIKEKVILEHKNSNSIQLNTSSCDFSTSTFITIINSTPLYYYKEYEYATFFENSGIFEIPSVNGVRVLLKGGIAHTFYGPVCCIGADDHLTININEIEVIDYDLSEGIRDPTNDGIDITYFVNYGTNTFSAIAFDTRGLYQWLTPLSIEVKVSPVQLDLHAEPDTLETGDYSNIYVDAMDGCGNPQMLRDDLQFTFSASSDNEYGHLVNPYGEPVSSPLVVSYEELKYNNIGYIADGEIPSSASPVTISVSTSDPTIPPAQTVITVDMPSCVEITLSPGRISPGDTASISVRKKKFDGTYEDYASDQLFNVWIQEGVAYGTLLSPDGTVTGEDLYNVTQGFKFVAAETIEEDTAFVKIIVWIPGSGGGGPSKTVKTRRKEDFVCGLGEVTVIKEDCILTPCTQFSINPNISDRPVNPPRSDRYGIDDRGVTYPVWEEVELQYEVCKSSEPSDCEASLNITNISIPIEYGIWEQNLTNYTLLPTDAEFIKSHPARCKIIRDLKLKLEKLLQPREERPQNEFYIDLTTGVPNEKYILIDATWDHEKLHVIQIKAQLQLAVNSLIDWATNTCLAKDKACKIKNNDQMEQILQLNIILQKLKEGYKTYSDNRKQYIDDELKAQEQQAKKYERILKELANVKCN